MNYINNIVILATALLAGLIAGVFYAYSCSVNPGLAKLSDIEYLKAMQSINIAILNPVFFASFMGSVVMLPLSAFMSYKAQLMPQFRWQSMAAIVYIIGVFGVTAIGNVPLNNAMAAFKLEGASVTELNEMRQSFEIPWNGYHLIRTICSCLSFLLFLISLIRFK